MQFYSCGKYMYMRCTSIFSVNLRLKISMSYTVKREPFGPMM